MNSIQYLLAGGLGAIFLMAFCLLTLVSGLVGPIVYVNADSPAVIAQCNG